MTSTIRGLVSKKKVRFQEDGFDLDLTYIRPNIIAMGFPSEGTSAMYRNPMADVQAFFAKRHPAHFKVYNLCSERKYDPKSFDNSCAHFPFDDHNPCPFEMVIRFCEDAYAFLNADPKNVIAVHCKAGKGRTGLMISSLLLFLGISPTAEEALSLFGGVRTSNGKGVTIPSQQRWVRYFQRYLERFYRPNEPFDFKGAAVVLERIVAGPAPDFDVGGGCDPYIVIKTAHGVTLYDQRKTKGAKIKKWNSKEPTREFNLNLPVSGDFKVLFYDQDAMSKDDKMFGFWLYTPFLTRNKLTLTKSLLDGAVKDKKHKKFAKDFKIEIFFSGVDEARFDADDVPPPPPAESDEDGDDDEDEDDDDDDDEAPSKEKGKKKDEAKK